MPALGTGSVYGGTTGKDGSGTCSGFLLRSRAGAVYRLERRGRGSQHPRPLTTGLRGDPYCSAFGDTPKDALADLLKAKEGSLQSESA